MRDFARRTAFATFVCLLFVATLGGLFGGAFAQGISNPRPLTSKAVIDALGYVPARGGVNNDISALDYLSKPLTGAQGGTGVANTGKTITLGGNLATAGGYGLTITLAGTTSVSFPVSGTLLTTDGGDGSGLTALNADNITTGTLAVERGGTGVATATGSGSVVRAISPTLVTPNIGVATGSSLGLTGSNRILSGLTAPVGGIAGGGYKFGTGENGVYWGSGAPTLSALQGSLYLRSNGPPSYNTNGTTGWEELVGLSAAQTLTGKTISGASNTFSNVAPTSLAAQVANTVIGNASASTASPTAVALPSCGGANNALTYTSGSGFGCNTITGTISVVPGMIYGLTMSTAGSSTTMTVAAGRATDRTNTSTLILPSAMSKTTAAWSAGGGNGCLDTGTIANNTWYHWFLMATASLSSVDLVCSTSATAPTLPGSYTLARRIGTAKTNGSAQWQKFLQSGDEFYMAEVSDFAPSSTSAATLRTLSIPSGIVVRPKMRAQGQGGSANGSRVQVAPAADATLLATVFGVDVGQSITSSNVVSAWDGPPSNTSGQINIAIPALQASGSLTIYTTGWIDRRGRDE